MVQLSWAREWHRPGNGWESWLLADGAGAALLLLLGGVLLQYLMRPYLMVRRLKRQGVPGPPFRPFVGQIKELFANRRPGYAPQPGAPALVFFSRFVREYGPLFVYCAGPQPRLALADPHLLRQAYVASNDCFRKTNILKSLRLFGDGLVTADGNAWARQRKLINPAFNHKEIKSMMGTMLECAHESLADWDRRLAAAAPSPSPSLELEAHEALTQMTLDVIGRTAFGASIADKEAAAVIYRSFQAYFAKATRALRMSIIYPGYRYLPLKANREVWAIEKQVNNMMMALIQKRRLTREHPEAAGSDGGASPGDRRVDLLELMLSATDGGPKMDPAKAPLMSDKQLVDECMTFLIAGHETTANLLTWTMLLLAQHPEWQERARAEVDAVVGAAAPGEEEGGGGSTAGRGTSPPAMAYEHLAQLKVVGTILNESLRLFPPAPMVARTCVRETRLGDVDVPAGIDIMVPIATLHRRPELWGPDAGEFNPARFDGGISAAATHPLAFVPFSVGPRTCIGQSFATVEAKAILAMILQRYTWRLGAGYRHHPTVELTLKPKYGVPIILERRVPL